MSTYTTTTANLVAGDVLDWDGSSTYVDHVRSVEWPTPPAVVAKVNVYRKYDDGRIVWTFFWSGIDAVHSVAYSV